MYKVQEKEDQQLWDKITFKKTLAQFVEDCEKDKLNTEHKNKIESTAAGLVSTLIKGISAYSGREKENTEEEVTKVTKLVSVLETILNLIADANDKLAEEQKIRPVLKDVSLTIDGEIADPVTNFNYWQLENCVFNASLYEGAPSWKHATLKNITFGKNSNYILQQLAEVDDYQNITFLNPIGHVDGFDSKTELNDEDQNNFLEKLHDLQEEITYLKKENQDLKRKLEIAETKTTKFSKGMG